MLASLSSMVCLGLGADPPLVEPGSVRMMDDGAEVVVRGLLVDIRTYDSGFESIVVSSWDGLSTLRVLVSQSLGPQPSEYARIGDTLRVFGRISNTGAEVVLYCEGGFVSVETRAESTLTVSTLSKTWRLFLGDELRLHGVIISPLASGGLRLFDEDLGCSIELRGVSTPLSGHLPVDVVLAGTLRLDGSSMVLYLDVHALALALQA